MWAIETENLRKRYKEVTAVGGVSLQVKEGELFALLGVNGAGKTTLIKMLCGLTAPTEGRAMVNGKDIRLFPSQVKADIGVSPQETAVAPNLTVKENLELLCGVYGFSKERRAERVAEIAAELGLNEVLSRRAGKLSGGWQRRLSIAMALVGEPKILFLDEPTLGLDVLARSELWERVRALKGRITVVLTTHYMEEAETLADRIGVMGGGKLIAVGALEELKERTGKERLEEAFIALVKEDVCGQ